MAAAIVAGLAGAAIQAQLNGGYSPELDEAACPSGGRFCDASAGMEPAGIDGPVVEDGVSGLSEERRLPGTGGEFGGATGGGVVSGGTSFGGDVSNSHFGDEPAASPLGGHESPESRANEQRSDSDVLKPLIPARNALPNQVTVADPAVRRRIGSQLDAVVAREVKALRDDLKTASMSDDVRENLLSNHVPASADPAVSAELKSALIDLDIDRFERSAKRLDIPAGVREENLPRLKLSRTLQDLQGLVKNAGTDDEVDAFVRRFEMDRDETGLSRDDQSRLAESVQGIVETLRIRRGINTPINAGSGTPAPAPKGEVDVVYFPPLAPSGKAFLIGDSVLAVGSATPGEPVIGRSEASQLLGIPAIEGNTADEISVERARETSHTGPMVLSLRDHALTVKYRLNNVDYTMRPGESQPLPKPQTWTIEFDRGNGSRVRYTLEDKAYAFVSENGVLDLRTQTFSTTIEHPVLTGQFWIVVDNEEIAIPAGRALTVASPYPIVVGFDRGNGAEPVYRRLFTGTYSTTTNETGWELLKISSSNASPPNSHDEASG